MSRLSCVVLTPMPADSQIVENFQVASKETGISFDFVVGDLGGMIEAVSGWVVLPEILVIDVPDDVDHAEALERLGAVMPSGETSVIMADVRNDIRVYRELKELGVVEVFDDAPSAEEAIKVLEGIQAQGVSRIGIDPRRVVFVFSACGGAGGSSVAMTFSKHFATEERRTLHIDMDLSTAPASLFFGADKGVRETSGLIDALTNPERIDALFLERTIQPAGKNLFYLSTRRRPEDQGMSGEALSHLISRAQANFDMIVVDIPWRAYPDPHFPTVFGPSYIVAPPTPAGLLGFSVLARELTGTASKSPMFGIVNRTGEFGSNDIPMSAFSADFSGDIMPIPFDAATAGKLFYEQKTFLDAGKKIRKPLMKILETLPRLDGEAGGAPKRRKTRRGFVAIGGPGCGNGGLVSRMMRKS